MLYRAGEIAQVGPREFKAVAATNLLQPDGYALDMAGANLYRFRQSGPLIEEHISCNILGLVLKAVTTAAALSVFCRFASEGVSPLADQKCREVKDGVLRNLSVGFTVEQAEPITPGRPRDGMRATAWTLLEVSLVSVPLDPGAVITERARRGLTTMPLTAAERAAEAARLAPKPPLYAGDRAHWAAAARDEWEERVLRYAVARRTDLGRRQQEARDLARKADL